LLDELDRTEPTALSRLLCRLWLWSHARCICLLF